jgi:hypothetical protein
MIDCLSKGTLLSDSDGNAIPRKDYPYRVDISVELYAPFPRATVTIEHTPDDSFDPDFVETLYYYPLDQPAACHASVIDFGQQRSFGMVTLWSLASLFCAPRAETSETSSQI